MSSHFVQSNLRYGVEITVAPVHVECDQLAQVLASLEGRDGIVRVFDRQNQDVIFDGSVEDVRKMLEVLCRVKTVGPELITANRLFAAVL